MERKIGEVIEINGKKYKCVTEGSCGECAFDFKEENAKYHFCVEHAEIIGACSSRIRTDKTTVNFVEIGGKNEK